MTDVELKALRELAAANVAFIVAARNALPALLDEVEQLQSALSHADERAGVELSAYLKLKAENERLRAALEIAAEVLGVEGCRDSARAARAALEGKP